MSKASRVRDTASTLLRPRSEHPTLCRRARRNSRPSAEGGGAVPASAPMERTSRIASAASCECVSQRGRLPSSCGKSAVSRWIGKRSMRGPESLRNPFSMSEMEHRHRAGPSPRNPHGQGFAEAPTMQAMGMRATPPARERCTSPDSSGPRNDSRTLRGNSANSSRQSMPPWARLISPGMRPELELLGNAPSMPSGVVVGCGVRKGTAPWESGGRPRKPRNRSFVARSRGSGLGSRPCRHRKKVDLPEPGGPRISTWWWPAAAATRRSRVSRSAVKSAKSTSRSGCSAASWEPLRARETSPRKWRTTSRRVTAGRQAPPETAACAGKRVSVQPTSSAALGAAR